MAVRDDYLVDALVDMGYVTTAQLDQVRADAGNNGEGLVDMLVSRSIIKPIDVITAKAAQFGAEVIDLAEMRIPDEVITAVPRHIAKRYKVVPVYAHDTSITIALSDPSDLDTIDSLHHLLRKEIDVRVATEESIEAAINRYYGSSDDSVGKMIQDITEGEVDLTNVIGQQLGDDDGAEVEADA
ncbi:MAG: type II/IV secretion system protein, partial [Pedosphaera parvula]|nr:type II/IV secretion system protein [Pedosphaera parvula]